MVGRIGIICRECVGEKQGQEREINAYKDKKGRAKEKDRARQTDKQTDVRTDRQKIKREYMIKGAPTRLGPSITSPYGRVRPSRSLLNVSES